MILLKHHRWSAGFNMDKSTVHLTTDYKTPYERTYVNTKTSARMRSSDGQFVKYVHDKHLKWLAAHQDSRTRLYDALEAFMDINGGMWPAKERAELIAAGRHAVSINIAKQKMETLNGSLMSEKFDFDYEAIDTDEDTLVENIKHWYHADKDQYNYESADSQTNMSGLLHSGVQEIFIDYSIRRTGAIGFRHRTDGTVLKDPYWQDSTAKNWREAMIEGYMTPLQMMEHFNSHHDALEMLSERDYFVGETYEPGDNIRAWEDLPRRDGSRYLVTEYRWMEKLKTTRLHARLPSGEWFAMPLKVQEDQVRDFITRHSINWYDVKEFPYEDNILYYGVISPDLVGIAPDLVLVRDKHPTQPGMIGLFNFSATRMFGIDKGMFEYILDINRTLNYRQSKMDDIISSAASGMTLVDKTKVGGDKGLRELTQNKTRPDYVHGVDGDPSNVAQLFPVGQVPEHIFRQVNELIDLFDRVSPVTPALEGAASADESGVLFEMRHAVTKLGTLRLYENWRQFLQDKAEAWYNQAQITYKDLYRKVPRSDGLGDVEFNVPAFRSDGSGKRRKVYLNSIEELPSARVVVKLSKSSPTERMARRIELFDTTKMLSAHPDLFKAEIRILTNDLIATIERTPEEQQKLQRVQLLQEMRDILEVFTQIEQLKASGMEAQAMQMQLQSMLQNVQQQMNPQGSSANTSGTPEQFMPADMSQASLTELQPEEVAAAPGESVDTIYGDFEPGSAQ